MRAPRYRVVLTFLLIVSCAAAAAPRLELPAFPLPALVQENGATLEVSPTRLLRELHRGGVRGSANLETVDADYALVRSDSLGVLAAWLESACRAVGFELEKARSGHSYDGTVLARLLTVATGLGSLEKGGLKLAVPIGTLVCERQAAWGDLPADDSTDAYVIFATESGIVIYDPPTRQLTNLADFPNRGQIKRIRF